MDQNFVHLQSNDGKTDAKWKLPFSGYCSLLVHNASKNGCQVWASTRMEIGRKLGIACECKT